MRYDLNNKPTKTSFGVLFYFLAVVIGIGFILGRFVGPDDWYANLIKPSFNPPNTVFGPVWSVLYIMIAVSGWRIWRVARNSMAMVLWGTQMLLNWLWTPVFFLLHQPGSALVVILLLLITVLLYIIQAKKHDKIASWLCIPYALWLGFASILNMSIYWLN